MEQPALEDLIDINSQLVALDRAGVALELGFACKGTGLQHRLEEIAARVSHQIVAGQAIQEALAEEHVAAPPGYRRLVELGLAGNLTEGLRLFRRPAKESARIGRELWLALFYPLLVCLFALAGLLFLSNYFEPVVGGLYESFSLEKPKSLSGLGYLREASLGMLVLLVLFLICFILLFARRIGGSDRRIANFDWLGSLSARKNGKARNSAALLAETVASLLGEGQPLVGALRRSSELVRAPQLRLASISLAETLENRSQPDPNDPKFRALPPLLRWALLTDSNVADQQTALRTVADVYRRDTAKGAVRISMLLPAITCIVIGGGATLIYALAVFLPVIDFITILS